MAAANEKLASALEALRQAQGSNNRKIFKSNTFSRTIRERLLEFGFLTEATKGWLYLTRPEATKGDTTPWVASFWEFCSAYAQERFGDEWWVSPEQSLLLAAEDAVIPRQLVITSPRGSNNTLSLPFGTSIFDLKGKPVDNDMLENVGGIRRLTVPAALVSVRETFFQQHPLSAQIALAQIRSGSELLGPLLEAGASVIAGRLAGAMRHVGRPKLADEIVRTMGSAGYSVRETNPFAPDNIPVLLQTANPIVGRLTGLWQSCRQAVIDQFPAAPGLPAEPSTYLDRVEEIYASDAYNSLSIEGYSVTPELIERVRSGSWTPKDNQADRTNRDAMAARGYWDAFQLVKQSLGAILEGADAGGIVEQDHNDWYRALFAPGVAAGLVKARDLAGYRNHPVFLQGSDYVPPRAEAVMDGMTTLFDLIRKEPEPSVRAVLGHWLFGYIHPYPDGNGRTGRFLLNALLASGGYPWTIVRLEDRTAYLDALDDASIRGNVTPFTRLIADRVGAAIDQHPASPATSDLGEP